MRRNICRFRFLTWVLALLVSGIFLKFAVEYLDPSLGDVEDEIEEKAALRNLVAKLEKLKHEPKKEKFIPAKMINLDREINDKIYLDDIPMLRESEENRQMEIDKKRHTTLQKLVVNAQENDKFLESIEEQNKPTAFRQTTTTEQPAEIVYRRTREIFNYTMVDYQRSERSSTQNILFFSTLWNKSAWWMSEETIDKNSKELRDCEVNDCVFTSNRTYLSQIHEFDMLLFYGSYFGWKNGINIQPIETRSAHQNYVFSYQEASMLFKSMYKDRTNIFNMTMTYRFDSDIWWYFGRFFEIDTGKFVGPATDVVWKEPDNNFQDDEVMDIILKKTKTAAWIVSRCDQPSGRDRLAQKLQNIIDVDIYGLCGTLKCAPYPAQCFDYDSTYKFYFAFENSLCKDYLTEKTFKVMNNYIIPVVFSGVDLNKFLPPRSYINANAFNTYEELAARLKFLADNPKEYAKYFWWKKYYRSQVEPKEVVDACQVCKKAHEARGKQHMIPSIDDWFNGKCVGAAIKF